MSSGAEACDQLGEPCLTDEQLIEAFRQRQVRRNLSPLTIKEREGRYRIFFEWLGKPLLAATADDVEQFLDGRPGRSGGQITPHARYTWISDLHQLYAWTMRDDIPGARDPTLRVDRPKLRQYLPRPISDENLALALSSSDRQLRAMLLCAYLGGARCREIALLERSDVLDAYDPPMVRWNGKGDKERLVPLHADLLDALRALPMPSSGRVFTHDGRPIAPHKVSRLANDHLHSLGIDDTMHSLRHWFGTRLYAGTKDLRVTQEMMGHSDPATTAGYTRYSPSTAANGVRGLGLSGARPSQPSAPAGLEWSEHDGDEIVRRIRRMHAEGMAWAAIEGRLNAEGITSVGREHKTWHRNTVRAVALRFPEESEPPRGVPGQRGAHR